VSEIENRVCAKILDRAAIGKAKYGTTMERDDVPTLEWMIYAQQEAMDFAVYLEKLIEKERESGESIPG